MIRGIIITVSCVFLIWFLIPLFTNVVPNIGTFTGIGVFAVLLLYGIFFPKVNHFLAGVWRTTAGKIFEILAAVILAAILILAVITFGCILNASGKKAEPDSTVVVLGCKVNGTVPSLTLSKRLNAAASYLEENTGSNCIVSGGQGKGEIVTEASVMYDWFLDRGFSEDRIFPESEAKDTQENLIKSMEIIEAHPEWGEKIAIATSDFHVYRALQIADSLGYDASPIAAKTAWWLYPTYVVREMYGILESWFLK